MNATFKYKFDFFSVDNFPEILRAGKLNAQDPKNTRTTWTA